MKDGYAVEYATTPINDKHPLASLAPDHATLKCKGDRFVMEMTSMSIFNTTFIYNPQSRFFAQAISFMDMHKVCIENEAEIHEDYEDFPLKLQETNDTMTIAGYHCKRVKATPLNNPSDTFSVYYTPELETVSSNEFNPYKGIHGMLLDYRLRRLGLELRFRAVSVNKMNIPDNTFEIPANYEHVTRKEMDKFFSEIQ